MGEPPLGSDAMRRRPRSESFDLAAPAAAGRAVLRKYAALCERYLELVYRELVDKYEADASRSSSVTLLALAAMRAGATALAAIRDGGFIVRNDRWHRIAGEGGGPWRLAGSDVDGGGAEEHATLEAVALAEAAELAGSAETARVARYERPGGEPIVEMRVERTQAASFALVLAMISDVTERVRSERELARMRDPMEAQERLRAVGELASGIAHDLNNTLHALGLRLSRLSGCVAGCPEHAEDLRVAERIASDAGARVRRLQDLAKRREDVPDESVDLAAVIAGAVEVARPEVSDPARGLSVDVTLPTLPRVVGNGAELEHVFVNLFLNAKDAMPGGGRIVVAGGTTSGGDIEVTVADEGRGIPRDFLERIFEPFFTTKGRRGTGLGLSMAAGVMRRLGGSISADNRPGGGAVFTVRFPPARAIRGGPSRRAAPTLDVPPRRVLVVDDDPDNLDGMRLVLAQHGHHVEVTDSGLDAVARVEAGERYDTVLCDLGLGDATGWDVAARIGMIAPSTRILLLTGWAEEIPADDPRRRHVARVLAKPLGVDELHEILREGPVREGPARHTPRAEPEATSPSASDTGLAR